MWRGDKGQPGRRSRCHLLRSLYVLFGWKVTSKYRAPPDPLASALPRLSNGTWLVLSRRTPYGIPSLPCIPTYFLRIAYHK